MSTNSTQQEVLKKILRQIQTNVQAALELLDGGNTHHASALLTTTPETDAQNNTRTIEGIFDGQKMVGSDGQTYPVAPNYASKSKLVMGDRMKLIITGSGNFVFKQIGPTERERVVGILALDPVTRQYVVASDGKEWKILTASVTYFHGELGDEVVVLVPKGQESAWAAVDNIVKRSL